VIPKSVISNEILWQILHQPLEGDYGSTDDKNCNLLLNSDYHELMQELTFWHELIHVLQHSYDLPDQDLDPESIAKYYGPALFAFMRRNFHELKWIDHERKSNSESVGSRDETPELV